MLTAVGGSSVLSLSQKPHDGGRAGPAIPGQTRCRGQSGGVAYAAHQAAWPPGSGVRAVNHLLLKVASGTVAPAQGGGPLEMQTPGACPNVLTRSLHDYKQGL